jgi:uncharacterized protein involved in exopolysaccharide biosynthesis
VNAMPHPTELQAVDTPPPPEPALGLREVGDVLAYVRTALGRRRLLIAVVALGVVGLTVLFLFAVPRTYSAESRILAMTDYQMPALANPHRTIPMYGDDPTRAAAPMLLSEQNLEWLVDEAQLERRFKASRTPIMRLKDQLRDLVFGPLTPVETKDALVKMLRTHLGVRASDHVISIYVSWFDPETTVLITRLLTDRFLEQRRSREVSGITDTLQVLESHAAQEKGRVDQGLKTLRQLRQARAKQVVKADRPVAAARQRGRAQSAELTDLAGQLAAKQQAIAAVEATRQGRLAQLRATLREKSTILAPGHPDIVELKQSIAALEAPSTELQHLQAQAASLRARYDALQRTQGGWRGTSIAQRAVELARNEVAEGDPAENQDPDIASARNQLLNALDAYDDLLGRISGATIELDVANAAFKYRYSVIGRPKLPEKPDKPNIPLVLVMGLVAGVVVSTGFALGLEVLGQRLLLPWQVERQLHLPYLGGVDG